MDELSDLDAVIGDASVAWWPNLRRELRRVGLPASPWGMSKMGAGLVSRRLGEADAAKFHQIDWAPWRPATSGAAPARRWPTLAAGDPPPPGPWPP